MKKLVKLLIATALIVTMAVCFAACGGKTMEKVYDLSGVKATAVATKTGQLNDFTDWDVYSHDGEWVVFYEETLAYKTEGTSQVRNPKEDTRTYKLYNAATEKIAATRTVKRGNAGFQAVFATREIMGESFGVEISRIDNDTVINTLYYAETSVSVGSVRENEISYNYDAGMAKIGDYIFKVVDGEVSHVENATASVGNVDKYMNGYYYDINEKGITVYDGNMNLYGFVRVPSYGYSNKFVLSNGNVLIQYQILQDPYGDDYDAIEVYEDGAYKTNLVTMLYNLEKNTAKEIKLDYFVEEVETKNLAEKVDNIAYMFEIKDNRIDWNNEAMIVAKLSNNGKVGTIYGKAEDYLVNAEVNAIATNRFLAKSISGEKVLYNEEMEKIATFTGEARVNEQYIVDGNKYYNFDGLLIADTSEYSGVVYYANGNAMFKKADIDNNTAEYFLLANGTISKVATVYTGAEDKTSGEKFANFGSNYYVITKWTKNAETGLVKNVDYVYNMNGQELTHTVEYVSVYAANSENKATVIANREVVTETEGLLVFRVDVAKYNENKDENDQVIGHEEFTEYYYCK